MKEIKILTLKNAVYIGQLKEGTSRIRDGVGITVFDNGSTTVFNIIIFVLFCIHEGFWKDNKFHGLGRATPINIIIKLLNYE